jgi:hypothetical protein
MSKITPLNNNVHMNIKVTESQDYTRFKEQHLIPIVVQDFSLLATEFPIVFVKHSDTKKFIPVAMMGVKPGVNLYCQTTNWTNKIIPLGFKNAPLSLMKANIESDEVAVCFDEESPLISEKTGEALFDEQGNQTEYLNARAQDLLTVAEFTQQTQTITDYLVKNELLTAKQLTLDLYDEDQPYVMNGLYLVDEDKLNKLPDSEFNELRAKGLLPLLYAQLNSIQQITRLTAKHNERQSK